MVLRYRVPLLGPFYYSGRVGSEHPRPVSRLYGFVPAQRGRVAVGVGRSV